MGIRRRPRIYRQVHQAGLVMSYLYQHKNGIWFYKVGLEDAQRLKELKDDSWRGTNHIAFLNLQDEEDWIRKVSATPFCLYMIATAKIRRTRKPIGIYKLSEIDNISRCATSGHDVFKNYRGKGYGNLILEAGIDFCFEVMNLHRVNSMALENNIASLKNTLYSGQQEEGRQKAAIRKCGHWLDAIIFGIVYEDWKQLDRVIAYGDSCSELC